MGERSGRLETKLEEITHWKENRKKERKGIDKREAV